MKKLLSYFWPITKKVNSDYSGPLEVTLYNGKKLLNSKNANYSFGSLQRILEKGISKIKLKNTHNILLLGLGGGSIITSLRKQFNFKGKIHAIEFDKKIISIANEEFHIQKSNNLIIEHVDAFKFVCNCKLLYNIIIVDLFIDNKVPAVFYSKKFCDKLSKILKNRGTIIFNLGINNQNENSQKQVINYFKAKKIFHCTMLNNVEETNSLLLIEKL